MKKLILISILILLGTTVNAQRKASREIFVRELGWTIQIPAYFEDADLEKWKKVRNVGKEAIEDTYNTQVDKPVKTMFLFKTEDECYFEATTELYDVKKRGADYDKNIEFNYNVFYNTLKKQTGDRIDTTKSVVMIDGLKFHRFTVSSSNNKRRTIIYSRLFGTRDLTVNIMYSNQEKGKLMEEAMRRSKFKKR